MIMYSVEILFAGSEVKQYFVEGNNGFIVMQEVMQRYYDELRHKTLIRLEIKIIQ